MCVCGGGRCGRVGVLFGGGGGMWMERSWGLDEFERYDRHKLLCVCVCVETRSNPPVDHRPLDRIDESSPSPHSELPLKQKRQAELVVVLDGMLTDSDKTSYVAGLARQGHYHARIAGCMRVWLIDWCVGVGVGLRLSALTEVS